MTIVSVSAHAPLPAAMRAVLATLPNQFRLVAADGDVRVVSADDLDARGAKGLVVMHPARIAADALDACLLEAAARQVPVVFGLPAAGGRTDAGALAEGAGMWAVLSLVSDVPAGGSLADALLDQMMVLRGEGTPVAALTMAVRRDDVLVLEGRTAADDAVRLTARFGRADRLELMAVSRAVRHEMVFALAPHARPSRISSFDERGEVRAWPDYGNGWRAAWQALHAAMHAARLPTAPLFDVRADLLMLRRSLGS